MNTSTSSSKAVLLLMICVMSWGSVFPLAKQILVDMNEMSLVLWRFTIAAASLLIYIVVRRQLWPVLSLAQYAFIAITSVVGVGGLNIALFTGLQHTAATNGALIMALSPVVTSLFASLFAKNWPSRSQVFSLIVGLSGVLLVITNGSLSRLLTLHFNRGDVIIMLGMLAWSFYTLSSKKISHWTPLIPFTLMSMLAGAATAGLVCLLTPNLHPLDELMALSLPSISIVIYIGLFATVVGYLFWNHGVKSLGAAKASLFFNFVPVFAALTSVLMGHEVSFLQVFGMIIVILGLLLPALVLIKTAKVTATTVS